MKNKLVVLAFAAVSIATPSFAQTRLAAGAFPLPVPQYLASVITEAVAYVAAVKSYYEAARRAM